MKITTRIHGEFNFDDKFQSLFDTMKRDKTIKEVTTIKSTINKNDRSKDIKIQNFKTIGYHNKRAGWSQKSGYVYLVETDKRDFYMNWLIDFQL